MDEKLIQHHMRTLGCTREEAIQLIKDDADVDRGKPKEWDLTAEQLKNQRKMVKTGTRKATAVTRTKKENPIKQSVMATIAQAMRNCPNCEKVEIVNPERTLNFTDSDGVEYTITLTAHRAKK